jgi:hypothetical protein
VISFQLSAISKEQELAKAYMGEVAQASGL